MAPVAEGRWRREEERRQPLWSTGLGSRVLSGEATTRIAMAIFLWLLPHSFGDWGRCNLQAAVGRGGRRLQRTGGRKDSEGKGERIVGIGEDSRFAG